MTERLANGTLLTIGESWAVITLPCGTEVHAHPNEDSPRMALLLGYGTDVARLTREHDPMHARLADWLGLSTSPALRVAAGLDPNSELAGLEEEAVLAIQRFRQACRHAGLLRS